MVGITINFTGSRNSPAGSGLFCALWAVDRQRRIASSSRECKPGMREDIFKGLTLRRGNYHLKMYSVRSTSSDWGVIQERRRIEETEYVVHCHDTTVLAREGQRNEAKVLCEACLMPRALGALLRHRAFHRGVASAPCASERKTESTIL
jgi:hypothetical protein